MSTTGRSPAARPASRNTNWSLRRVGVTASLTTPGRRAARAPTRPTRSSGMPAKSWRDRITRPGNAAMSASPKAASHSTSTYAEPASSASRSRASRADSSPSNIPPSRTGRYVTTARLLASPITSATGRFGRRSSRNSTRSATRNASARAAGNASASRSARVKTSVGGVGMAFNVLRSAFDVLRSTFPETKQKAPIRQGAEGAPGIRVISVWSMRG